MICVGLLVKLAVVKGVVQLVSTFLKRFLHKMVALNSQGRLTERTKIKSHYYCPSNHYYLGGGILVVATTCYSYYYCSWSSAVWLDHL